jgi:hypothetical protein
VAPAQARCARIWPRICAPSWTVSSRACTSWATRAAPSSMRCPNGSCRATASRPPAAALAAPSAPRIPTSERPTAHERTYPHLLSWHPCRPPGTRDPYGVTRRSPRVPARLLLRLIRAHWHSENRWHDVRDVTRGEDASRVRSGTAPQARAALRNAVLSVLRHHHSDHIAAALRHFAWSPGAALHLLGLRSP